MSTNERMLWGVRYSDNTLRLRTTGTRQAAGVLLVTTLLLLVGSVVATPDALTRRWLGVRRLRWDEVDYLQIVEHVPPWWILGAWFAVDVVQVSTRDGRTLMLWPTLCTVAERSGSAGPTPAQVKRNLLQRYRETYAPDGTSQRDA